MSRVMSTHRLTTNSRSAALVERRRDSPDIHWTLSGSLVCHFFKEEKKKKTECKRSKIHPSMR